MQIRSLLIASAAAVTAFSSAQAADAIVAAEPEPLEYVRVCDAFGTGYFYIPGTETCLSISGYVRFQTDFGRDEFNAGRGTSDWDSFTRAQLDLSAKSDTEFGALEGFIGLRGDADNGANRGVRVDQAFIELGGLKVGYFYSWWDDDLSGETDILSSNETRHNAVRYTYKTDTFSAAVSVEELEEAYYTTPNGVGVSGQLSVTLGGVNAYLLGSYDTDTEEGAVRTIITADLGPGTLGLAGVWASGQNAYYDTSEWAVAAEYKIKATEKFAITPAFQYLGTLDKNAAGSFVGSRDAWTAGVTLDYQIADKLSTKLAVNYLDADGAAETWTGFLRLQRAF